MKTGRQYDSGAALRTALEERLKRISREEAVDLHRLRRQVGFDRLLARLFQIGRSDWVLKGGYAMELRFHTARATKDLDFTVRTKSEGILEHLVVECCRLTFARRDTHPIPRALEAPPERWTAPFVVLAEACSLAISAGEAFSDLAGYFDCLQLHV